MTDSTSPTDSRSYHHGDLPQALMDAAVDHIAAEGTEKLSLRALARECGVSPTAPYRHFPSKRCLLAAISTRGFQELRRHCEDTLDDNMSLEERLLALGQAYIAYAVANPTTYQVMFSTVLEDFSEYEQLAAAAEDSYALVLEVMAELVETVPTLNMTASQLGGVVWSAVHGIASLLLFHQTRDGEGVPGTPLASLRTLQADPDSALKLLMRGLFSGEFPNATA